MKRIFVKKAVIIICLLMLGIPASLAADNLENLRYSDNNWEPYYLELLESGPAILKEAEIFVVEPPPANASETTKRELSELRQLSKIARDPETLRRIRYENNNVSLTEIFSHEGLIAPGNEKTVELLEAIDHDHIYFSLYYKKKFSRPRPSALDPSLNLAIPNPRHAAYPSGHAGQAYMNALVLADFDPDNAEVYRQFALDIARRREIAGVHYPSDSEAGRKLAVQILERMREKEAFEQRYQAAKASYIPPRLNNEKK